MSKSHAEKVQQTFLAALEVDDEQRDAWLVQKCGSDEALLTEVRSLLNHADPSVDLLEQKLDEVVADIPHLDEEAEPAATQETDEPQEDIDCDDFLSKLSAVGVLSPDEFASVSDSVSTGTPPPDARQLASQLVTNGKLTSYQASALLKGEPELLIDKYLILDLIDVGGMGMVFKALHRTMHRIVALKMMSQQMLASEDQVRRFKREVRVAATLEHPNIVRAYDADEARGVHFLVMEYVRGDNLSRIVRTSGPLSLNQAVDCIRQTAIGLQHAHERGIVHRDIKPGNLLLDDQGTVKILDLGLAHIDDSLRHSPAGSETTDDESGRPFVSQSELTAAGAILGTASFMAPEQSLDAHLVDFRSDIYSLGCTLYFLLTGEAPYTGNTIFKVFVQHREGDIPPLQKQRPDVPDSVAAVFEKMVAKKPEDRYQTARELIVALEDCHIPPPVKEVPQPSQKTVDTPSDPGPTISDPGTIQHAGSTSSAQKHYLLAAACAIVLVGITAFLWPRESEQTGALPAGENSFEATEPVPALVTATIEQEQKPDQPVNPQTSLADLLTSGEWEWQVTKNLGPLINSNEFEFGGDITADGLTLVFTTCRDKSNQKSPSHLWIATRTSPDAPWSNPEILPPEANLEGYNTFPQISADGLSLSFKHKNSQFYLTTRKSLNAPWQEAIPDPIAVGHRRDYRLTPDGLTAFRPRIVTAENQFPGRESSLMIWRRDALDSPFGERSEEPLPVDRKIGNVGALSDDGRFYLFHQKEDLETDPDEALGKLHYSTRPDWNSAWSEPVLAFKNDPNPSGRPRLLRDGRSFLFVAGRPTGYGASDLWLAELVRKTPEAEASETTDTSPAEE
ncbi:serine/threonine-protein kinase [Gimesia sp.]|uniref:serine/threonine protein kinase n=1 Tax=Gimesia sp. TaxID=2024833 RepID=UPI0032EAC26F